MSLNLTFYGAVNEIGGSKTLLQHDGTSILFDFGKDFLAEQITSVIA